MFVGVSSYKRLEYGRCHLEHQCYYTDLTECKSVFVFDNRIYRRYDRLHHIVQQMRKTNDNQYFENSHFFCCGFHKQLSQMLFHQYEVNRSTPVEFAFDDTNFLKSEFRVKPAGVHVPCLGIYP